MTRDEYIKQLLKQDEIVVYKLFKKMLNPITNEYGFYTLYVGTDKEYKLNTWYEAIEGNYIIDSKGRKRVIIGGENAKYKKSKSTLAYRPGFHSGILPVADQIGISLKGINGCKSSKPVYRRDNEVWIKCIVKNKNNFTELAKSKGKKHYNQCLDYVPKNGFYFFNTNNNLTGTWLISGEIKLVEEISTEEVYHINNKFENPIHDLPKVPVNLRQLLKKKLFRK